SFRDGVGERNVGYFERAEPELSVLLLNDVQLHLSGDASLIELPEDQLGRERRGVKRNAKIGSEIRHSADVVFMSMGKDNAGEAVEPLLDKFRIGEDQFGAGIFIRAETHPEIDHHPLALATVEVKIHSDFARPTQGQEKQLILRRKVLFQATPA